jgi:hypothetical protein
MQGIVPDTPARMRLPRRVAHDPLHRRTTATGTGDGSVRSERRTRCPTFRRRPAEEKQRRSETQRPDQVEDLR